MKHTVSVAQLKKMGACPDQVKTFAEHFGTGDVTVTRKRLLMAAKLQLDVSFWFRNTFPPLLNDDYRAKVKPIDDDHRAKRKLLYNDYMAKRKLLYDDYEAKRRLLYDDYRAKRKPIDDDHMAKVATLIADLLGLP